MALSAEQVSKVETTLKDSLRKKFQNYRPEPGKMPFHTRLLGQDKMALFSFIHSLNTNFGTSIFEPIAKTLAATTFKLAESQQIAGIHISADAQKVIQNILDSLTMATSSPDKLAEIAAIKAVCQRGEMRQVKLTKVDLKIIALDGTIFLIDLKTAKPNVGAFKEFKRTLLEWVAAVLAIDPDAKIQTLIAIPYNPYEPEPYERWTMRGMLDLPNELKVADKFWDFLGGVGTYPQLLDIFEKVGIELRPELDNYFLQYNTTGSARINS